MQQYITCRIGNDLIHVDLALCTAGDQLNIDSLKAVVACLYYLQFPAEKRSEGRQFLVYVFSVTVNNVSIEDHQPT